MKKHISFQNKNLTYTLRKSKRARRMRLAVYSDSTIVVTSPFDLNENIIEKFIREKSNWLFSKITFFKQFKGQAIGKYSRRDYIKNKQAAQNLAIKRVDYFNKIYKFKFNNINIKNQKTRWGSCSKKGNLNFNYKIILLPPKIADYIIVHELCHLGEFNHSKRFWNLVGKTVPDYHKIKDDLKKSGVIFY
jgi:predicted metal-dependent hydrolase